MSFYKIFLGFALCVIFQNALATEKLVFSLDLIRHGDRNPIYSIPGVKWDGRLGELTAKGVAQETQLGGKLRKFYIAKNLLPQRYDPNTLYVRSTDSERTIKSANALLLGLYPLNTRGKNREIAVEIVPKSKDHLLVVKPSKNIISIADRYFLERKLWKEKTASLQPKLKYWSQITGLPLTNFQQIAQLGDTLYIIKSNHRAVVGISDQDADDIIALTDFAITNEFKIKSVTEPMGKTFLKNAMDYFKQVTANKTALKYVLLSGHDSSVMSVMNTLGVPLDHLPDYASRLNFSLFKNQNQYYVKISYNDKLVYVPACKNNVCTLSQFENLALDS